MCHFHSQKLVFQAKQKFYIEHTPLSQPRTTTFKYKYKIITCRNLSWISVNDSLSPSRYIHYHQQELPATPSLQLPPHRQAPVSGPSQGGAGAGACAGASEQAAQELPDQEHGRPLSRPPRSCHLNQMAKRRVRPLLDVPLWKSLRERDGLFSFRLSVQPWTCFLS